MKDDRDSKQLPYATPAQPRVGSPEVPVPYVLFGICMLPLILGILIASKMDTPFGLLIAIPSGIGSIVLPIVSQMREH